MSSMLDKPLNKQQKQQIRTHYLATYKQLKQLRKNYVKGLLTSEEWHESVEALRIESLEYHRQFEPNWVAWIMNKNKR